MNYATVNFIPEQNKLRKSLSVQSVFLLWYVFLCASTPDTITADYTRATFGPFSPRWYVQSVVLLLSGIAISSHRITQWSTDESKKTRRKTQPWCLSFWERTEEKQASSWKLERDKKSSTLPPNVEDGMHFKLLTETLYFTPSYSHPLRSRFFNSVPLIVRNTSGLLFLGTWKIGW